MQQPHLLPNPGRAEEVDRMLPVEATLPEKRELPPIPEGEFTRAVGEAYCKVICDTYPEVFDGEKGQFIGAGATMFI